MVMGSDVGGQGRSKGRSTKKQPSGGSSLVVGGGLVVGIATVVVVGVAGKLFSKSRKTNASANDTTPYITHTDNSLHKIIHEENSDLPVIVEGGTGPPNEAVVNRKSDSSLYLQNGRSDHNDVGNTTDGVDHVDSAHSDLQTDSSPQSIIGSTSSPGKLDSDDSGFLIHQHSRELEGFSTTTAVALSELVDHALIDAEHNSPSKHELLGKTEVVQDGIAGVISCTVFEDFTYGDTSSDELTPTKVKLRVSWEINSSAGSEEEGAQVHPGELFAENELWMPGCTKTEAAKHIIERINHDAPVGQDKEVARESLHSSPAPFQEQGKEPQGTTTTEEIEIRGEAIAEEAGSSVGGNESTNLEVVPEVQQDNIAPENSVGVLQSKEEIEELACLLDELVKKETASQECDDIQKHADHNEESRVTSLLGSTKNPPGGLTDVKGADSVQTSTQLAEKEGATVAVLATSHEVTNVVVVASKESTIAAATRQTTVATAVGSMSRTGGGLQQEELGQSRRGNRLPLEVLGLALTVALIAVLVWSIGARFTPAEINPSVI